MFLRNYWYVAAYDRDITQRPLGRMILGEPIVFYRLEDGTPVALEDRCAHRHLPLSMGTLVGDTLHGLYHGLRYDKPGTCLRVPGPDRVRGSRRARERQAMGRHRRVQLHAHAAERADREPLFVGAGAELRHRHPEEDRHAE